MNLKEIAEYCNVSPSAVSLVLNNKAGISKEKRSYISEILRQNGYEIQKSKKENKSIRFLKYSKYPDFDYGKPEFSTAIIDSVEEECRRHGFDLVMTSFREKDLNEISRMITDNPLDGIIFLGTEFEKKYLNYFENLSVPIVFVNNRMETEKYDSVTMDSIASVYKAIRHLLELGHRKIAYLCNSMPSNSALEYREAFECCIKNLAIPFHSDSVYVVPPAISDSCEHIYELLQCGTVFPSALIASNDSIAAGAIKAFRRSGIRVPEDISIIGLGDKEFATVSEPPLTTLRINHKDIGKWAVQLLANRLLYPDSPSVKIQIGAELVVRGSTAPKH